MRGLLAHALLALATVPLAAAETLPPLALEELDALRYVLYHIPGQLLGDGVEDHIIRELRITAPWLTEEQIARVDHRVRHDTTMRPAVAEILTVRGEWRQRPGEALNTWWDPRQASLDGLPSRAPTRAEADELEAFVRETSMEFGVEVPRQMPYRIDKRVAGSRVFPRSDLRWGVVTDRVGDRHAVAKALLLARTDNPVLCEVLALERAGCGTDAACRAALLEQARAHAATSGYVDVVAALAAEAVGDLSDPAVASMMLVLDRIRREQSPATVLALAGAQRKGLPLEEVRLSFRNTVRMGPARLDQEVRRSLREWAAATQPR